jgi:hypothetical protein
VTPRQAKEERAKLVRAIRAEEKRKDRARLGTLRQEVRDARKRRAAAIAEARRACANRRKKVPTLREAAAMLRAARAEARATCDASLSKARTLKGAEARARAERQAEAAHQRTMRRLERHAKERAGELRPSLAKARVRRQESDDEVRANIPPERAFLFERVKRQIKGSPRRTRTEEFLDYAHEHPDEELEALEDKTDAMIREHEQRQRRHANPRRPPKAWWDDCIARVEAAAKASGRKVREPRAVCGAAWWSLPPQKRAAIVRALERAKHPRARGAALALARLEKKRRPNVGTRDCGGWDPNYPEGWGQCDPKTVPASARKFLRRQNPRELVSLVYLEQKPGDREPYEYEHEFEGELPQLVMRGGKAQIRGGSYETRAGWLEG